MVLDWPLEDGDNVYDAVLIVAPAEYGPLSDRALAPLRVGSGSFFSVDWGCH